jgi:hypothetical protein
MFIAIVTLPLFSFISSTEFNVVQSSVRIEGGSGIGWETVKKETASKT